MRPARWLAILTVAASCTPAFAADPAPADHIFQGGPIITMDRAHPSAEAVAVRKGKIVAVGTRADVGRLRGERTTIHDLAGKTLLPGFIDPHSHFTGAMVLSKAANISAPPVGPVTSIADLVRVLKAFQAERKIPAGEPILGYGYDGDRLSDGRELTRDDLDPAFPDNPVAVLHVSCHGAVLNSAAFKQFGISASTPTPPGGLILRRPGSNEPAGLLMETAFLPIVDKLPPPDPAEAMAQLKHVQTLYTAAGITTAQDGATRFPELELLQRAAAAGVFVIDIVAYPFISDLDATLAKNLPSTFGRYTNRLKLGGVKIVADGSPQAKTARFTTPYLTGGPSGERAWYGEMTFPQEELDALVKRVYDNHLQLLVHANGDGTIDSVLTAHARAAAGDPAADRRTTIVHSQFVRPDQLGAYVKYHLIPSFYTEHTYFFADVHRKNRGAVQTAFISPMRAALDKGLKPTNHTDFIVLPINQMTVVWTAVNRVDREGKLIGPDQRVTPLEALEAITIHAAYQYSEEDSKGSIEPGKRADLVILDRDPLTVTPLEIKDIQVVETIKDGTTVYRKH